MKKERKTKGRKKKRMNKKKRTRLQLSERPSKRYNDCLMHNEHQHETDKTKANPIVKRLAGSFVCAFVLHPGCLWKPNINMCWSVIFNRKKKVHINWVALFHIERCFWRQLASFDLFGTLLQIANRCGQVCSNGYFSTHSSIEFVSMWERNLNCWRNVNTKFIWEDKLHKHITFACIVLI